MTPNDTLNTLRTILTLATLAYVVIHAITILFSHHKHKLTAEIHNIILGALVIIILNYSGTILTWITNTLDSLLHLNA